MILRRLGNKSKIAEKIQEFFPPHKAYIEPFFGAGGMFFNKPKAQYNILNDLDNDVFNLFEVVRNHADEFREALEITPYHNGVFEHFKKNLEPESKIWQAVRFVYLSNFGYLGKPNNLHFGFESNKAHALCKLNQTINFLKDTEIQFTNCDFRKVVKKISFKNDQLLIDKAFIYCDPPYLGTDDNYSNSFTEQDSLDLFNCLEASGCKFAMSEFDHPFIVDQAKERGLNVHVIGERLNLKNRKTEILVTNYRNLPSLF